MCYGVTFHGVINFPMLFGWKSAERYPALGEGTRIVLWLCFDVMPSEVGTNEGIHTVHTEMEC